MSTARPVVLWIVGEPGVGKTTLARTFIPASSFERSLVERPKWTECPEVVLAGHYTGATFDGADTVPYNGVLTALTFWLGRYTRKPLTIFDGDRFSNRGVMVGSFRSRIGKELDIALACIHLTGAEVAAARRVKRGTTQNASWVAGRGTKARRFFELFPEEERLELDAHLTIDVLHAQARQFLNKRAAL